MLHDRTENACTVSTSLCPIQSLKALYGTTCGTYSARVFRPVMYSQSDTVWATTQKKINNFDKICRRDVRYTIWKVRTYMNIQI